MVRWVELFGGILCLGAQWRDIVKGAWIIGGILCLGGSMEGFCGGFNGGSLYIVSLCIYAPCHEVARTYNIIPFYMISSQCHSIICNGLNIGHFILIKRSEEKENF